MKREYHEDGWILPSAAFVMRQIDEQSTDVDRSVFCWNVCPYFVVRLATPEKIRGRGG